MPWGDKGKPKVLLSKSRFRRDCLEVLSFPLSLVQKMPDFSMEMSITGMVSLVSLLGEQTVTYFLTFSFGILLD